MANQKKQEARAAARVLRLILYFLASRVHPQQPHPAPVAALPAQRFSPHPSLEIRLSVSSIPSLPNPRSRKPTVRQTPLLAVYGDKLGVTRCHSDWPLGLLGSVLPPSRSNPPRWWQPDASVVHRQRVATLIRKVHALLPLGLPLLLPSPPSRALRSLSRAQAPTAGCAHIHSLPLSPYPAPSPRRK